MSLALLGVRETLRLRISGLYLEPMLRFPCLAPLRASQSHARHFAGYRGLPLPCCGRCDGRGVAGVLSRCLQGFELQAAPFHPLFLVDIMISLYRTACNACVCGVSVL